MNYIYDSCVCFRLKNGRHFYKVLNFLFVILLIFLLKHIGVIRFNVENIPGAQYVMNPVFVNGMSNNITIPAEEEPKKPLPENVVEEAIAKLPNLPVAFWNKMLGQQLKYNNTCAKFPSILELNYNNVHWQMLPTSNGTFYLLSAYYDVRALNKLAPTIRIVGMIDRIQPTVKTFCQLWFENDKKPVFAPISEYRYIWYSKWGNFKQGINQPYLMSCTVPKSHKDKVPVAVSVVEKECENATTLLRVVYNKPEKKKPFAVCVKGLDFIHTDLTVRMVEWIELLGILGADKIFIYELQTHPNISRMLQYYERTGQVSVTPLTLPGNQPNSPYLQHLYLTKKMIHKRQNEVIPYNDCLYKNLYTYDYVVLLDIDEVIMPVKRESWHDLIQDVLAMQPKGKPIPNTFSSSNVYFLDDAQHAHGWYKDIPRHLHMLQHVYRAINFTKPGQYVKCFHDTEKVLILHNHFPFGCLGNCKSFAIPTEDSQLQHYRKDCVGTLKNSCKDFRANTVVDTAIWKFKDKLIARTNKVFKAIGYHVER